MSPGAQHVVSGTLSAVHLTDSSDATWIAELLAHGLIKPSFVPPPEIRALHDLPRMRVSLVQTRAQGKNRMYKILEDTDITLASVVSDVFGKSARTAHHAKLIAGSLELVDV